MIEDSAKGEQMIVMNDRSAGGSAWRNGTIEIGINRRMNTSDDLGNDEVLNETYLVNGKTLGVRTHAKYVLAFTSYRQESFDKIRRNFVLG